MRVFKLKNMVGVTKDPALFLLLGSIGLFLFGSIGYGIYTLLDHPLIS